MTNAVGANVSTAPVQPDLRLTPETQSRTAAPGAYAAGDQLQTSSVAAPRKKTLAEQLTDVGHVKEGSGFVSKVWNWMNLPKVEAAREFGSAFLHNGPSLIIEMSKKSAVGAASELAGGAGAISELATSGTSLAAKVGSAGTAVAGKIGKVTQAAGSSGIMAVLAKVGAVTGSIGGVVQLLRDMVQAKANPPSKLEKGLLMSGGFLAATGSVIALCGAAFPGAVIGLMGTLIHASGLWKKATRQDEEHMGQQFDPQRYA
jgi:hypothetical protein